MPGANGGENELVRLDRQPVPFRDLVRNLADDERPAHVGEARRLGVSRPEVDHDRLAGAELPVTQVMPDRRLRSVRDDELVGGGSVGHELGGDRLLDELDGQRVPVELEHPLVVGSGVGAEARPPQPSRPRRRPEPGGSRRARRPS